MSPSMSLNVTFLDFFCNDSLKLYVMFAEPPARSSIMFHFKIRGQTLLTPGKWLRCSYKTRWKETPTPPCTHTHTCSANHYFSKTISECLLIYPCPSRSHQCLHLSAIDLPAVCGIEELPIWESGNFSKKTRLLTTFSQIKIPRRHTGVGGVQILPFHSKEMLLQKRTWKWALRMSSLHFATIFPQFALTESSVMCFWNACIALQFTLAHFKY